MTASASPPCRRRHRLLASACILLLGPALVLAQAPAAPAPAASPDVPAAPAPPSAPDVPPAPAAPAAAPGSTAPATPGSGGAAAPGEGGVTLDALGWLAGCWRGSVNQRVFREQWLPLAGGMMLGAGQTVTQGRTQDYEYLRIESRAEGVFYVTQAAGQKDASFRFSSVTRDEVNPATLYTFENVVPDFPQRLVYRRASEGWLYVHVEGRLGGQERKVIYPMRRVNCETDEFIRQ